MAAVLCQSIWATASVPDFAVAAASEFELTYLGPDGLCCQRLLKLVAGRFCQVVRCSPGLPHIDDQDGVVPMTTVA
jgi:hypothetical protein